MIGHGFSEALTRLDLSRRNGGLARTVLRASVKSKKTIDKGKNAHYKDMSHPSLTRDSNSRRAHGVDKSISGSSVAPSSTPGAVAPSEGTITSRPGGSKTSLMG